MVDVVSHSPSLLFPLPFFFPLQIRRAAKLAKSSQFARRKAAQEEYQERAKNFDLPEDELEGIFDE